MLKGYEQYVSLPFYCIKLILQRFPPAVNPKYHYLDYIIPPFSYRDFPYTFPVYKIPLRAGLKFRYNVNYVLPHALVII
jgi:hypothetical protein